jgi:hypothetical protein
MGNILRDTHGLYSLEALEFFRLFPDAVDFRLSTAVRLSASFPYFSPAAVLPTIPRRRAVDAGYYDTYGVSLAAAWLYAEREWLRENVSGVVLIQIRDGLSIHERTEAGAQGDTSTILSRGLEWLTSPPQGFLHARDWTMSFRNDQQLEVLTEFFDERVANLFFTTAAFEYPGNASLSWYLADHERDSILREAERLGQAPVMHELLDWWRERQ